MWLDKISEFLNICFHSSHLCDCKLYSIIWRFPSKIICNLFFSTKVVLKKKDKNLFKEALDCIEETYQEKFCKKNAEVISIASIKKKADIIPLQK